MQRILAGERACGHGAHLVGLKTPLIPPLPAAADVGGFNRVHELSSYALAGETSAGLRFAANHCCNGRVWLTITIWSRLQALPRWQPCPARCVGRRRGPRCDA